MENKRQKVTELGEQILSEITGSADKWRGFLDTAAWMYKYPFYEKTLIYAQRPNATACASFEVWNNRLNRRIKKGTKGIVLINPNNNREPMRHIFDISDTYSPDNAEFKLWEMPEDSEERIVSELEDNFGDALYPDSGYEEKIASIIENTVEDNITEFYAEYGQFVSEVKDEIPQTEYTFKTLVEESVKYMTAVRMGLDVNSLLSESPFEDISEFADEHSAAAIGEAVSQISEMLLRQVERTVYEIRAEERKKFAEQQKSVQNVSKDITEKIERSAQDGNSIRGAGRRDTLSPVGDAGAAGGQHRQVRADEEGISRKPQESDVQPADYERSVEKAPDGNRPGGNGASRGDYQDAGESAEHQRGIEEKRPDGLGRSDEQPKALGGRNRDTRPYNDLTQKSQQDIMKEPEEKTFGSFAIPQEYIEDALRFGGNKENSLERIITWYSREHSEEGNIQFLKEEYGKGGLGYYEGDKAISCMFTPTGIDFALGESVATSKNRAKVPWDKCSLIIENLLNSGNYVSQDSIDKAFEYEKHSLASGIYFLMRDILRGFEHGLWEQRTLADEAIKNIESMLNTSEGLEKITDVMNRAHRYIQTDTITQNTVTYYDKVNKQFKEFKKPSVPYPVTLYQNKGLKRFITKDEIFLFLMSYEHVSNSKLSTYDFFRKESDNQKRADFLKELHGTGGVYGNTALGDGFEDHSAKGVTIAKGRPQNPYASYYRVVVFKDPLQGLCYTDKDAVDWLNHLPPDGFTEAPPTALYQFVDQLDTAGRFILNEVTSVKSSVVQQYQILTLGVLYGFCWY